jgi:predicted nucleic acid-binding protein
VAEREGIKDIISINSDFHKTEKSSFLNNIFLTS